jgi:hypothetical protein
VVEETVAQIQAHRDTGTLEHPQFNTPQPVLKFFSFLEVNWHFQNYCGKFITARGCRRSTSDSCNDRESRGFEIRIATVHRRHTEPLVS